MSNPFTTTCPHCHKVLQIPFDSVAHHVHREHGLRGATKRKQKDPDYLRNMVLKRWSSKPLHTTQQAILALSQEEDIEQLTLNEIAAKVGVVGPWPQNYIWRHIKQLQKKGLLPNKSDGI